MSDEAITGHPNKPPKIEMDKVRMVQTSDEEPNGLRLNMMAQNGLVILDLGEPVQYIGFRTEDAQLMTVGFVEATLASMHLKKADKSSVN